MKSERARAASVLVKGKQVELWFELYAPSLHRSKREKSGTRSEDIERERRNIAISDKNNKKLHITARLRARLKRKFSHMHRFAPAIITINYGSVSLPCADE